MFKSRILSLAILCFSLTVLLVSSVGITFGFVVTKTNSIVNTFVPIDSEIENIGLSITVNKAVNNLSEDTIGPDGFEFVLENTENGEKTLATTNKEGVAVIVLEYTSDDIGKDFSYKLFETEAGMPGVLYDKSVYDIAVSVYLNSENKLDTQVIMNGEAVDTPVARFVNVYHNGDYVIPPTKDNSKIKILLALVVLSSASCILFSLARKKKIK